MPSCVSPASYADVFHVIYGLRVDRQNRLFGSNSLISIMQSPIAIALLRHYLQPIIQREKYSFSPLTHEYFAILNAMKKILSPEPAISPLFLKNISLTSNTVGDAARFRQHADAVIAQWRERGQIHTAQNVQGHRYKVSYQLVHGTQQICAIQLDPVQPNHSGFRLDYSPAHVSSQSRQLLQQHLNALFLTDYGEVMRNAKLVAVELAVDISNVSFANLVVAEKRKRSSSVYGQFMDQGGNIESLQLGAARSDGQIRIVDHTRVLDETGGKNAKASDILRMRVEATLIPRIDTSKATPPSATPSATKSAHGTTGAKSKLRSGVYLRELDLLRNPFDRVQLFSLSAADALRKDYRWQIFLRCCERIGAQAALALLPDKKRAVYLRRFSQGAFHWWEPSKIWEGLRAAFDDLGLFPESAFTNAR